MNMAWGRNGAWYRNMSVGLLVYSTTLTPLAAVFLWHIPINLKLAMLVLAGTIVGTLIIVNSLLYNFKRQNRCVQLSRSLDQLLDAERVPLPDYVQKQTLLAAELERLDSLTRP